MLYDLILYLSLLAPVVALPVLLLMVRIEQWAAGTPVLPKLKAPYAARLGRAATRLFPRHAEPHDRVRVTTRVALGQRR